MGILSTQLPKYFLQHSLRSQLGSLKPEKNLPLTENPQCARSYFLTNIALSKPCDLAIEPRKGECCAEWLRKQKHQIDLEDSYPDPELAKMVKQTNQAGLSDIPVPLSKDDEMKAYLKANQPMIERTLLVSAIVVVLIVGAMALAMAIIYGGFR